MPTSPANPLKAVVFDLGNVLLYFDYGILIRKLVPLTRLNEAELHKLLNQSPLLYQFETGLLSTEQFYQEVSAATCFTGTIEQFEEIFGDIFRPEPRMIELNRQLRQKGFQTFIFSNTNDIAVRFIRRTYPFFAEFDRWFFSHEARSMKPDSGIYELLERESGLTEDQLLYIDDRKENIDAGASRGWQIIWHQDVDSTLASAAAWTGL